MKNITVLAILLFTFFSGISQNYEKILLDSQSDIGYYLAIRPKGEIEGVLVLFPGFAEKPEDVLPETKLHNTAFNNNILTLVIPFGAKLYADAPTIIWINRALEDSIKRFKVSKNKFVIGGFSAGGTVALEAVN